jgi:hypothetical protein
MAPDSWDTLYIEKEVERKRPWSVLGIPDCHRFRPDGLKENRENLESEELVYEPESEPEASKTRRRNNSH